MFWQPAVFFTVELFTGRKLIRCTVFFVIELHEKGLFCPYSASTRWQLDETDGTNNNRL